jgi:hypothetical protein
LGENINIIKKNTKILLDNKKKVFTSREREREIDREREREREG